MKAELAPICLLGRSIRLWPVTSADAQALFAIHRDPWVSRFTSAQPPHRTLEDTRAMLSDILGRPGAEIWMMDDREPGESAAPGLGWVGLFSSRTGVADLSINLRQDAQGRGRARQAMSCAMLHGFEQRGFKRIGVDIDAENTRSIRMVEALGLSFEGRLRHHWKTPMGWRDSMIFSVINHDVQHLKSRWLELGAAG